MHACVLARRLSVVTSPLGAMGLLADMIEHSHEVSITYGECCDRHGQAVGLQLQYMYEVVMKTWGSNRVQQQLQHPVLCSIASPSDSD